MNFVNHSNNIARNWTCAVELFSDQLTQQNQLQEMHLWTWRRPFHTGIKIYQFDGFRRTVCFFLLQWPSILCSASVVYTRSNVHSAIRLTWRHGSSNNEEERMTCARMCISIPYCCTTQILARTEATCVPNFSNDFRRFTSQKELDLFFLILDS